VKVVRLFVVGVCLAAAIACSKASTPASPTPPPTGASKLTAPNAASPNNAEQLTTLRPTLTVTNGSSDQTGTRTYEFQISDRSDFGASTSSSQYYMTTLTKTGVTEGIGSTSVTIDTDLQPATRLYWRARFVQGATTSDWSSVRSLKTQIVGYNKPGELYDPLVNGQTVAELQYKRTTFFPGRGLRVDDSDSYVRYLLPQTIVNGEFSVDVEGLSDAPVSENPNTSKLKVFSMTNTTTDIYSSHYNCNVQYRGYNGNPDHAIAFKCLFGDDLEDHQVETDLGARRAGIRSLSASNTYYFKATWGSFFHLTVQDGGPGASTGSGGETIYDYGLNTSGTYNPSPHYAYLGVNNSGSETGSWPGAIYRNLWIGSKSRPASLGSALRPE